MPEAALNAWEKLNVHRAWNLTKASLQYGGDMQALGMLMESLVVLKNHFTEDARAKNNMFKRTERPITASVASLYVDVASAVSRMTDIGSAQFVMTSVSACEWVLNLLLEAHQRPLGAEDEKRLKMAAIHLSSKMYACHRLMGNIPAAWMVIRRLNRIPVDTGDKSERKLMQEVLELEARSYASTKFGVTFKPPHLPDPSPLVYHHSARMTGAALDNEMASIMRKSSKIICAAGDSVFASIQEDAVRSSGVPMHRINIFRFRPCQPRSGAAKTLVKLGKVSAMSMEFEAGVIFDQRFYMAGFNGDLGGPLIGWDTNFQREVNVYTNYKLGGHMAGRRGASLVACRDMILAFGGVSDAPGGGAPILHNTVCFVSGAIPGNTQAYTMIETRGIAPEPCYGHSAWMINDKMCVFGGVARETEAESRLFRGDKKRRLKTLNDLWRLNTATWEWERLQPLGLVPCPRSHAGIACSGLDVFIIGGKALPDGVGRQMALADVFQFHPKESCWVQVLPESGSKAWMSARHSPACAVLDSGRVAVLGGFGADDRSVGMDVCLTLNISRCGATGSITRPLNVQGDEGGDCVAMLAWESAQHRYVRPISARLRVILDGPPGCATFLTFNQETLACGFCVQENVLLSRRMPFVRAMFGEGLALTATREALLGVSEGERGKFWRQGGCPYNTMPLWLGWPSEAVLHQCARDNESILRSLTQVVKVFGTRKAACEYFHMTQPNLQCLQAGWSSLGATEFEKEVPGQLSELLVFAHDKEPGHPRQLYMVGVMGNCYGCWLATLAPAGRGGVSKRDEMMTLLVIMAGVLSALVDIGFSVECANCGQPEEMALDGQQHYVKVCRGCRLVRYCSKECQAAAWPQHKAVCRKFRLRN